MAQQQSNDASPKVLRRTVIKLTAAGATMGAIGGAASMPAAAQEDSEAQVVIPRQVTDGQSIEIESATLPNGGFLSLVNPVHAHDHPAYWPVEGEGMPSLSEVLDAQFVATTGYLEEGTHENLTWDLSDNPLNHEDNRLFQVWVHQDTNDSGEFEFVSSLGEEDMWYPGNEPEIETEMPEVVMGDARIQVDAITYELIQDLQQQLEDLGVENDDLQSRLSDLEDENADMAELITALEEENMDLQEQLDALESNNTAMESRLDELEGNNADLQSQLDDLQTQLSDVEDENADLADQIEELQSGDDGIPGFGILVALAAGGAAGGAIAKGRMDDDSDDDAE